MTGNTHKIIALKAMDHFHLQQKQRQGFLMGNVMADYLPIYNYRRHYPAKSMEYVLNMNQTIDSFFELGILTHFVSDFLCTPHFNNWKLYSPKGVKHLRFEKNLEKVAEEFDFLSVEINGSKCSCINDQVLDLYEQAGEDYDENIKSAYLAVCFMLESFVKV